MRFTQKINTLKKSDPPYRNTPKNYDPPSNLPTPPQVIINERSLIGYLKCTKIIGQGLQFYTPLTIPQFGW